jgi:hypothetical protein
MTASSSTSREQVQMIIRVPKADRAALEAIRQREGISLTYQLRRAIRLWLAAHAKTRGQHG